MVSLGMMALGAGMLAVGGLGFKYGYQLSRFSEQMDSIGSTTPMNEVEPAGWKVFLTQACFVVLGGVGLLMLVASIFQP